MVLFKGMNKQILLLTGPPGAGKGTQAEIFASRHNWYTFSIGQLLRDTADPEVRKLMDAGDLLPKEHVARLVIDEINNSSKSVIVDGYPRRLDQIEEFDRLMEQHKDYLVIALQVTQEVSWQRIMDRHRPDDEHNVWQHRWQEYYDHTVPAIEYCREQGKLREIDGNGSIESVTSAMEEVFHAA